VNEILWGEVHSTYCSKYTLTIWITVIFIHASKDYFHTSKLNLPPKLFLYRSYTPTHYFYVFVLLISELIKSNIHFYRPSLVARVNSTHLCDDT
jgi:hypothetical protein